MTTSNDRWARLQSLYHEALELPEPERKAFLENACGTDTELRAEVLRLLKHANLDDAPIQQAIAREAQTAIDVNDISGTLIGAYRIEKEIGRGGMGRVFLAHRDDDLYEQTVAIKLLKTSTLSDTAVAMFELERQTLARLSHVNVAVLLDGGTTGEGIPYVVMQYVDGPRLDDYAKQNSLGLTARLTLFLKVCEAVNHAHRNLVVHRDIKPSNVLVTAEGEPKLLDFGIAKMLDEQSSGMTQISVMTPPYASPEQIEGQPVTVQTDVYSLGALLYELLTDRPPFELVGSTAAEAAATICHTMPALPSEAGTAAEVGSAALRGDLDNIIFKAMRKEPQRRYDSVQALADDVEAYLENRPVSAQPDSWRYRLGKFVARNTASVAIATLAFLLLTGLVSFYTFQLQGQRDRALAAEQQAQESAKRANEEAQTSNRVSEFLVDLFDVNDPRAGARKDITARELLDEGRLKILNELDTEPGVKAHLMRVMGLAYGHMGEYESSIELLEQSLANTRLDPGSDKLDVAEALNRLAEMLRQQGNLERASLLHREALDIRKALSTGPTWGLGDSHNNFGLLQYSMGNFDYAIELATIAVDNHRNASDSSPTSLGISMHNLALYQRQIGRYATAEDTMQKALEHLVTGGQRERTTYAISLGLVARIKSELADFTGAENVMTEALAISKRHYEPDNPRMASMWERIATAKCGQGNYSEALKHYDDALAIYIKSHGLRSSKYSAIAHSKANCHLNQGKAQRAETLLREVQDVEIELYTANHVWVGITETLLAHALLDQNKKDEAHSLLKAALPKLEKSFDASHPVVIRAQLGLARVMALDNNAADAQVLVEQQIERLEARAPSPLSVDSLLYASDVAACMGNTELTAQLRNDAWRQVQHYAPTHYEPERYLKRAFTCAAAD